MNGEISVKHFKGSVTEYKLLFLVYIEVWLQIIIFKKSNLMFFVSAHNLYVAIANNIATKCKIIHF